MCRQTRRRSQAAASTRTRSTASCRRSRSATVQVVSGARRGLARSSGTLLSPPLCVRSRAAAPLSFTMARSRGPLQTTLRRAACSSPRRTCASTTASGSRPCRLPIAASGSLSCLPTLKVVWPQNSHSARTRHCTSTRARFSLSHVHCVCVRVLQASPRFRCSTCSSSTTCKIWASIRQTTCTSRSRRRSSPLPTVPSFMCVTRAKCLTLDHAPPL